MIFALASQFSAYSLWVNSVLNVVGAFNQEQALVEAFSGIVKSSRRFVANLIHHLSICLLRSSSSSLSLTSAFLASSTTARSLASSWLFLW